MTEAENAVKPAPSETVDTSPALMSKPTEGSVIVGQNPDGSLILSEPNRQSNTILPQPAKTKVKYGIDEAEAEQIQTDIEKRNPKYSEEAPTKREPTPGTTLSIDKYGTEGDFQRSIAAVKAGTKPALIVGSPAKAKMAEEAGLVYHGFKDNFGYVFSTGDELGISRANRANI